MQSLTKDPLELIIANLKPYEIVKLCHSFVSEEMKRLCNDRKFWDRRIRQDFPFIIPFLISNDSKKNYFILVNTISNTVSEIVNLISQLYDHIKEYLKPDFKDNIYRLTYEVIIKTLTDIITLVENNKIKSYKSFNKKLKKIKDYSVLNNLVNNDFIQKDNIDMKINDCIIEFIEILTGIFENFSDKNKIKTHLSELPAIRRRPAPLSDSDSEKFPSFESDSPLNSPRNYYLQKIK